MRKLIFSLWLLVSLSTQAQFSARLLDTTNELYPLYGNNPHIIGNGAERKLVWHVWVANYGPTNFYTEGYYCAAKLLPVATVGGAESLGKLIAKPIPSGTELDAKPENKTQTHFIAANVPNGDYYFIADITDKTKSLAVVSITIRIVNTDVYLVDSNPFQRIPRRFQ